MRYVRYVICLINYIFSEQYSRKIILRAWIEDSEISWSEKLIFKRSCMLTLFVCWTSPIFKSDLQIWTIALHFNYLTNTFHLTFGQHQTVVHSNEIEEISMEKIYTNYRETYGICYMSLSFRMAIPKNTFSECSSSCERIWLKFDFF